MSRTRVCSALLGSALFALVTFAVGSAQAGFLGDTVSVDLTVHTTGATDQTVFSSDLATIGSPVVELTGISDPDSPGDQLVWTLDLDDDTITLVVHDINTADLLDVGPVHLDVNGLDAMAFSGVNVILDEFGFGLGDITFGSDWVSVDSLGGLNLIPSGGTLTLVLQLVTVPEPSSLALAGMAMFGLAVAAVRRKRRS